jgi:ABC-type branched-subunit amino acid transport system substrate-binding protein
MKQMRWILLLTSLLILPETSSAAVTLGQSCALTGPTAFLGTEMRQGGKAYFDHHAADDVVLISKDDGYEPDRCRVNTEAFLDDRVQALFGYVGTPTAAVAAPLANAQKTVFFGAFTGAGFLSDAAANPYSFALRASYDAEVENMMRRLKEDLGVRKVSLFVQKDAFGLAGVSAALKAVEKVKGLEIVPPMPPIPEEGEDASEFWNSVPHYKRNTVSVGGGVRQVRGNGAEAVILVGTSRPCALAINQWHKMDFKVPMISLSFVGSTALAARLKDADNVYISQVVPDPWNDELPIVKQYQEALGNDSSKYDFVSLEGYIAANVMHKAISSVQGAVNSESLKKALESMADYDLGGLTVSYAQDDHRGLDAVYLTKIEKSDDNSIKFVYIDKLPKAEK